MGICEIIKAAEALLLQCTDFGLFSFFFILHISNSPPPPQAHEWFNGPVPRPQLDAVASKSIREAKVGGRG